MISKNYKYKEINTNPWFWFKKWTGVTLNIVHCHGECLRADKMEVSPEGYIRMLAGGNR